MIYITGDIHGRIDIDKLNSKKFPQGKALTKDDYVIIVGDFGLVWNNDKEDRYWRKWLNEKPWTTLFIDGNHENFDLLDNYPVESWNGGLVSKIESSIYHLKRGQIFTLDGLTFFTFGGARSIDRVYRTEGKSWWPQEEPKEFEYLRAWGNLDRVRHQVDYILTHEAPGQLYTLLTKDTPYPLSQFLQNIDEKVTYQHWYFGHHHINITIDNKSCLYEKIIQL